MVEVERWMSASEFAALFAIGNVAPGPNVLVVTLVGWRVAGWAGALVTTLAMVGTTSLLTFAAFQVWNRLAHAPWRRPVQNGLRPSRSGSSERRPTCWRARPTGASRSRPSRSRTALATYFTRMNPLWAFGAAAALGAIGLD